MMTIAGEVAQDLLLRFPDAPIRQLARIAYRENKEIYTSPDNALLSLRYYSGTIGKNKRKQIAPQFVRDPEVGKQNYKNPFGFPKSDSDHWRPRTFPIKKGNGLFIADTHIPYHDVEALTIAFNWAKDQGYLDFLFIDGDFHDSYQLSKFERDPRKRDFVGELDVAGKFLDSSAKLFKTIILKKGNHDNWLERYLKRKAPELFGLKNFLWDEYLHIKDRGIIVYEHDVPLRIGKLNILHGHEYRMAPVIVNPARTIYLKTHECTIVGHWHRSSLHTDTSINRRWDACWSVGCTCCLWPEYSRLNNWNHGFSGLLIDGTDFKIRNKRILKGKVY